MANSAARQAVYRKRMAEYGLTQVTVWVPVSHAPDVMHVARVLCEERSYELGPFRDTLTGKLVRKE